MMRDRGYGGRLVGDRFDVVPAQSAFGCVARLCRLNQFGAGDLQGMFGLRVRRADDLMRVLALSSRQQEALADALGIERAATWIPWTWHPFSGGPGLLGLDSFRYCLACMRVGYHCHLHQLPWISRCPWHGVRLRTACPRCGGPIAVSGDTDRKLLTCACGFDLVDERSAARHAAPPHGATETIRRYLAWSRESSHSQVLMGSADVPVTSEIAAALVELPEDMVSCAVDEVVRRAHFHHYRKGFPETKLRLEEDARRLDGLSGDCPQLLELPGFLLEAARAVASDLAAKLPVGSLTEREQLIFLGTPDANLSDFEPADRPTSGTVRCLPPMAVGPRRFLDLTSIHPIVIRTIVGLPIASPTGERWGDTHRDRAATGLDRRIQADLLCRGYAEGLRAVLSRYVPALYDLGRDRPHLTAAWTLIRTAPPFTARVAFAALDRGAAAPDVLASARPRRR